MRFLIFTTDCPPLPGLPTSGTALRTFGIAQGLQQNGHEVIISPPSSAMRAIKADVPDSVKIILEELKLNSFDSSNQKSLVSKFNPDVIICGHWPALSLNTKPSQIVVLDLAGPHMLERHYQKSPNQHGALLAKLTNLAQADFYIVSGEKQKYYFLSYLLRAGVENPENRMIKIPMALSPNMPDIDPEKFTDPKFVFAGVFLPWQDPSLGLKQLLTEIEKRQKGSLKLIGGAHPNYNIKGGIYQSLFEELSKSSSVTTKPMLPYEGFIQELADRNAALDLMAWNLERELAVTIRTTTFLWAGLPVIYNNYSDLSELIKKYNAGWTVEPGQQLQEAIEEIYANPQLLLEKAKNAQKLSRENFLWNNSVRPLLNLVSGPEQFKLKETDIVADYPGANKIQISKDSPATQFFTCRVSGLSRIEFKVDNEDAQGTIKASLFETENNIENWDSEKAKPITKKEIELHGNNEWCCFDFAPIKDSAGKVFAFSIEFENQLSPTTSRGSYYPLLGLMAEGKTIPHTSLCFRTQCTKNCVLVGH